MKNNKKHLYCEADRKFRSCNGMELENDIRASGFINNLTSSEIENKIQNSYRAREKYWLKLIINEDQWPVLLICGAVHAIPFSNLLTYHNIKAVIIASDWKN